MTKRAAKDKVSSDTSYRWVIMVVNVKRQAVFQYSDRVASSLVKEQTLISVYGSYSSRCLDWHLGRIRRRDRCIVMYTTLLSLMCSLSPLLVAFSTPPP